VIIGLVHVIIVTDAVMFIVYLIVCTVRSLRVTVTINKVLSYSTLIASLLIIDVKVCEILQATDCAVSVS